MTIRDKYEDVIKAAVRQPRFWQWGRGGRITKLDIKDANFRHEWQIKIQAYSELDHEDIFHYFNSLKDFGFENINITVTKV